MLVEANVKEEGNEIRIEETVLFSTARRIMEGPSVDEVRWAIRTRSDPGKDIDIIWRTPSSALDPTIRRPAEAFFASRAIIDPC